MLSNGDLKVIRDAFGELLPDTANVQRRAAVSDGGGGTTYTWSTVLTAVPCRISPVAGGETGSKGGRVVDETTHVVTFRNGTDIRHPDRLVIAGKTYEVTNVRKRGQWEFTRRVEAKEMPAS